MEIQIQSAVQFGTEICISCGVHFAMPLVLQNKLRDNHEWFYCPNGHVQHYVGKTEAEKVREELKRKEQELANVVQQKYTIQGELDLANKKLKRVSKGVCPCCNRSFSDLHKHMKSKHPEVIAKCKS